MRAVNIHSLLATRATVEPELFRQYLSYVGQDTLRPHEWDCLQAFVSSLAHYGEDLPRMLDGFYLGYTIPQIGKEFDLLCIAERAGEPQLISIELKSRAGIEKIRRQLQRNEYYLRFSERKLHLYSYEQARDQLYRLVGDELEPADMRDLAELLGSVRSDTSVLLSELFDPNRYLVSPFTSPERFIEKGYFLTGQQESIRRELLRFVLEPHPEARCASIEGDAGTGKTLLVYDIAHELMRHQRRVLILHASKLNAGQQYLSEQHGWDIKACRSVAPEACRGYDLVIIDEAQRLSKAQLKRLTKQSERCLIAFDALQCLTEEELRQNTKALILYLSTGHSYRLTEKIRTNRAIAEFVRQLLDRKRRGIVQSEGIELYNFYSADDVRRFLLVKRAQGWVVPRYIPSEDMPYRYETYTPEDSASAEDIVGQDYDSIVVVLDDTFYYNKEGLLCNSLDDSFALYSLRQMFYQIITRIRKRLCLVLLSNDAVLRHCLSVLQRRVP